MSIIQLLLVAGALSSLILYLKYYRTTISDRLIGLLLFMMTVTAILVPQLTTNIANMIGVGRGTDLVIYLFIVTSIFSFILMRTRLAMMEESLTKVVRHLAISEAEKGPTMKRKSATNGSDSVET